MEPAEPHQVDDRRCYRVFGLVVSLNLPMPMLPPAQGPADIEVQVHQASVDEVSAFLDTSPPLESDSAALRFAFAEVGIFEVLAGRRIILRLTSQADLDNIRFYLLGTLLPLALHQRGFLILHAGAVVLEGEAVAFAGSSGAGKSTITAAFNGLGCPLLTDDITIIDLAGERPLVHPSHPHIKLDPAAAQMLGIDPTRLELLHSAEPTKRGLQLTQLIQRDPVPLRLICLLGSEDDPAGLQPLHPAIAYRRLIPQVYPTLLNLPAKPADFQALARLLKVTPVLNLARPRQLTNHAPLLEQLRATIPPPNESTARCRG